MQEYIRERCRAVGVYLIETGCTVRAAAMKFGISKSSVHKDVTDRLEAVDPTLAAEVRRVLCLNKEQRHIRGGEATMRKYRSKNMCLKPE